MKKIITLVVAVSLCLMVLAACSGKKTDWESIQEKGFFVCGITLYEPMNYFGDDGELTGFDTEFAQLVAQELGLEAKFQIISWGNKYVELNTYAIDCIWNGFTANSKDDDGQLRSDKVSFTIPYLDNAQSVVIKADRAGEFTSTESLSGKTCAVEAGSAGASYAATVTDSDKIIQKTSQKDTFMELASGNVDFIVVDVLLANELVGKGDYANLAKATSIAIDKEEYAIGMRKGSDFTEKVNEVIKKLAKNGKLSELAEKYGVSLTETLAAMEE